MMKLISLNIERSKHLHLNLPFFREHQPDILCLQEVLEADRERIGREVGLPYHIWLKDSITDDPTNSDGKTGYCGSALFSRTPFLGSGSEYYYMPERGIALQGESERYPETNANGIVWASFEKEGVVYTVANTHFTWSPDGTATPKQYADFQSLKKILDTLPPHVLVGDLNAPRGRGVWECFADYYGQDNIPIDITSTIDPQLHRIKGLELVIDALFTQLPYRVTGIDIVEGVSDHKAVVASIEKVSKE